MWAALLLYWTAVKDTFPQAWGKPPDAEPPDARRGHPGHGTADGPRSWPPSTPGSPAQREQVHADLALLAPYCHWTEGRWDGLGMRWNEIQNVPRHIHELSSYLMRTYLHARAGQR